MTVVEATVSDVLRRATECLAEAAVEGPRVDAEFLVGAVLGLSRSELNAAGERAVTEAERAEIEGLVERRRRREPLQYVLGEWGFRRLTLKVDPRALIPRPETEVVVERVLALLTGRDAPAVLDVGTGSGAIALAVADEHPGARVLGIDSSAAALSLARENAVACDLDVEFEQHDVFDGLPSGPWDVVVSNPPYVRPADRGTLAREVREWEPAEALFDVGATEATARAAAEVLAQGGALVLEIGDGQAGAALKLLSTLGYADVRVTRDLSGRERVVEGTR